MSEAAYDLTDIVTEEHLTILHGMVSFSLNQGFAFNGRMLLREPDLTIAPDGVPYLYRWHILPRNDKANVYLHLQVGDDPERPMHDHQYDNQSVILAGGYHETYQHVAHGRLLWSPMERDVRAGQVVHRRAEEAHRLKLLRGEPYAITLFTTGPRIREWGFWLNSGWVPWHQVTEGDYREGGVSKWKDANQ